MTINQTTISKENGVTVFTIQKNANLKMGCNVFTIIIPKGSGNILRQQMLETMGPKPVFIYEKESGVTVNALLSDVIEKTLSATDPLIIKLNTGIWDLDAAYEEMKQHGIVKTTNMLILVFQRLTKTCENCINYTRNDRCTVKKEYKFKNETCEQWTGK